MPIRLTGINSGMDTESMIKKIMDAEKMRLKKVDDKKVKLEWKQEKWKDLNTKLYSLYTKRVSSLRFSKAYQTKNGKSSNEGIATVTADAGTGIGNYTLKVKEIASAHTLTSAKLTASEEITLDTDLTDLDIDHGTMLGIEVNGVKKELEVNGGVTVNDYLSFLREAGINANFDVKQQRFYLSAKEAGASKNFTLTETYDSEPVDNGLKKLGLKESAGATEKKGTDAIYNLNGVEYTSETNDVSVNGLDIKLKGRTQNYGAPNEQTISLSVTADVQKAYDNFKSFIKEYNEIIKEMNKLFYADVAKGYQPLSKEEKSEMSEKDIEQWETKIKDSILRRDERLGSVLNTMKSAMNASVQVGEKRYSLASFGVMTSKDFREKGLLHIFGDTEDGVYGEKEDKLKKALIEEPEQTAEALKGIMEGLYNRMTDAMKGTGLSSALTFYNDKEYNKQLDGYKEQYSKLEKKLTAIEDKYYKQFAAMEKAMAKLNSQNNYLAGMLGGR